MQMGVIIRRLCARAVHVCRLGYIPSTPQNACQRRMITVVASTAGNVVLDGLRVNQLKLSKNLAGSLQVSDKEVHMHAKVCCWFSSYQCLVL